MSKKKYTTTIEAIDPHDGKLKTFHGPYIYGKDKEEATIYMVAHNLEYCVIGEEVVEITETKNT